MTKPANPRAFPPPDFYAFPWSVNGAICPGMTLRDYFAGQALSSMGTWLPISGGTSLTSREAHETRAQWAYAQADAMITERAK